ncbi:hypothetical protein NDU88_001039 [Pleurodeles waltl]|uniref:PAR14-like first RRM domain-containing protein n=1 Tax=Pleurodeles waltl TaxID=8319 RepID=A0AAV7TGQ4_PLEWA|nr:hypothetical protein NDU88_001039 [Pleurodeles waltl]
MGDEAYPYPVLVRGAWGSQGCTKAVKNKLLCYFQSQKKSGGGECQVTDSRPGDVLVHFAGHEGLHQGGEEQAAVLLPEPEEVRRGRVSGHRLPSRGGAGALCGA